MVLIVFVIFAVFALYTFNNMANQLCVKKELSEEQQPAIFRWINVLVTTLLISSYVKILLVA